MRLFFIALLCAMALVAQTQMNVDQLAEFLRSELALRQHTDKQIAAAVRKLQLTEKLTDKTILDLQAQGAGPKTVEALRALKEESANQKAPAHDSTYSPATAADQQSAQMPTATLAPKAPVIPPPDSVKQKQIIDAMRDYALDYTKNLPNFLCVEMTRQYVDPNAGDHYRSTGTILARVGYNEGREHYNVYSLNGKLVDTTMDSVRSGGAVSTGEFGSMMREIFEPDSEAEFNWDHWGKLRDRVVAVFSYFIDSGHSKWSITYGADKNDSQRIITAYKGLVYADANTGEIARIKFIAVDIPRSFPVSETTETLDYDLVDISNQKFVVPLKAVLTMRAGREASKNEIEFRNYRKFGVESGITYDMAPLPESKTEEKPVESAPAPPPAKPVKKDNPWVLPTAPPPPSQ